VAKEGGVTVITIYRKNMKAKGGQIAYCLRPVMLLLNITTVDKSDLMAMA
jgi:hypothetical protein